MSNELLIGSVNKGNEAFFIADYLKKNNKCSLLYIARDDKEIFDFKLKIAWLMHFHAFLQICIAFYCIFIVFYYILMYSYFIVLHFYSILMHKRFLHSANTWQYVPIHKLILL